MRNPFKRAPIDISHIQQQEDPLVRGGVEFKQAFRKEVASWVGEVLGNGAIARLFEPHPQILEELRFGMEKVYLYEAQLASNSPEAVKAAVLKAGRDLAQALKDKYKDLLLG